MDQNQGHSSEERSEDRAGSVPTGRPDPTADLLFGVLARATNRFVLQYLIDSRRPVSVNELVEYAVTATDAAPAGTVGELRGSVRKSVERSVADLEAAGFLRHDPSTGTVEATGRAELAVPHLELARERLPPSGD